MHRRVRTLALFSLFAGDRAGIGMGMGMGGRAVDGWMDGWVGDAGVWDSGGTAGLCKRGVRGGMGGVV